MRRSSASLGLLTLALSACGGSDGFMKRRDAAAAADGGTVRPKDGGRDFPASFDTSPPAVDSAGVRDGSTERGLRIDAPWTTSDVLDLCHVEITPITPATLVNLIAGPTAMVRIQGTPVWETTAPFAPTWTWSVTRSDGKAVESRSYGSDPSQIQFSIAAAGRYDIVVDIGGNCGGSAHALVQESTDHFRLYHLRVLPPAAAASAVPYEADVRIATGGTAMTKDFALDTGVLVTIDPATSPSSALQVAVPSYIRLQSTGSTWVTYGRSGHAAPFRAPLDLMLEYEALVVPDPPGDGSVGLPPYLLGRANNNNVKVDARYLGAYANPLPLPAGIAITGRLLDPDGNPAEGATISLRSYQSPTAAAQTDLLFSTVGRADGDGNYVLRVNPAGSFSVVVTPAPGSALATATIDQAINLTDASMVVPEVDFEWLPLATTDLDIAVTAPGGAPIADAVAVRIESVAKDPTVAGHLSMKADEGGDAASWTPPPAIANVRRDATTDRRGKATFPALPKGTYDITLVPPATLGWAITKHRIDAKLAADGMSIALPLASKVMVIGHLLDAQGTPTDAAGATVMATDLGTDAMAPVAEALVATDGSYVLLLDPQRTYSLSARPVAGRGLPFYVPLYGFSTGRGTLVLDDQRIPKGVLVQGHVTYAGAPVAAAVVQAFCMGLPPDCLDRTNLAAGSPPVFASAISDSGGYYAVYLPEPPAAE